jgi:hypothetical protein
MTVVQGSSHGREGRHTAVKKKRKLVWRATPNLFQKVSFGLLRRRIELKMPTTAFIEVLTTVRQTAAAHASALDEFELVFAAETVMLQQ